ncbi:hypothetical protein CLV42_101861 [Chitinophaga ginsengisoli]|uniref:Uncharacterized protein n=1 Tax=Chitinophaga ginsengisoli TaxID=363837 RepID=A0A2P8GQ50_9BACT|nr:hypothetical protein CLV42_101861 [Chitinophaga ginsengisoli]
MTFDSYKAEVLVQAEAEIVLHLPKYLPNEAQLLSLLQSGTGTILRSKKLSVCLKKDV